jgi:electron transport complex protein RnfG
MRSIKYFIQQSWLLIVAAFCFGLLLALTSAALKEKIQTNEIGALYDKMKSLMPQAEDFEKSLADTEVGPTKTDIYKAVDTNKQTTGFAFVGVGPGFADKIKLVIAVNKDCTQLLGFEVLSSNETPGFGSRITEDWFRAQFIGAPAAELEVAKSGDAEKIDTEIIALTGATVSSDAVVKIFNSHIEAMKKMLQEKGLIE